MDKTKNAEFSGKYCQKLGCDVVICREPDDDGNERSRCLSSHLCREDERMVCGTSGYIMKKENNEI